MEVSSYTSRYATSSASVVGHGPSGKLPIELLSEIFLQCVEDGVDAENTILIPLLLSKICARWRFAAISNPNLWSRLSIHLQGQTSDKDPALIDTWLSRSAACPLTIYIFWEDEPFEDSHPILEKIMDHCQRWKTMFFYLPYRAFASFQRIRGRLPMLTDLSLGMGDEIPPRPPHSPAPILDMFQLAPRLRSIECVNMPSTIFKFPWSQLREIPVFAGNIIQFLELLQRSEQLAKMSYIFTEGGPPAPQTILAQPVLPISPPVPDPYPHICHNQLTSLTIMTPQFNECIDLSPLFPHIHIPNLESLTICNLDSPFGNEFTQFLSGLHALRTLHLRKTSLPDELLVEGLKHLPSLTNLIVLSSGLATRPFPTEQTVTRYLLEALTRNFFSEDAMEGMLLPRLKRLELTVSSEAVRELDTFIDMLQSRLRSDEHEPFGDFGGGSSPLSSPTSEMGGLARLEHVRVRPSIDLDDEFLVRLIELKDMGLEVEVENIKGAVRGIARQH